MTISVNDLQDKLDDKDGEQLVVVRVKTAKGEELLHVADVEKESSEGTTNVVLTVNQY